jgi:hypothetical protein
MLQCCGLWTEAVCEMISKHRAHIADTQSS